MVHFTKTKAPATEEQIRGIEALIGVTLPSDYREFLKKYIGGYPHPSCFRISWPEGHPLEKKGYKEYYVDYLLTLDESDTTSSWFNAGYAPYMDPKGEGYRIPLDTIPIVADGHNNILLGVKGKNCGKVFFWMSDYEVDDRYVDGDYLRVEGLSEEEAYANVGFVANSFTEFLESLHERKEY